LRSIADGWGWGTHLLFSFILVWVPIILSFLGTNSEFLGGTGRKEEGTAIWVMGMYNFIFT